MRFRYKNEIPTQVINYYLFGILIIIMFIFFSVKTPFSWDIRKNIPEVFSDDWNISAMFASVFFMITMIKARIVGSSAINHRKWHKRLVRHGRKYTGEVKEVVRQANIKADRFEYRFKVEYMSEFNECMREFVTPILNIEPDSNTRYVCDVYEMDGPEYSDTGEDEGGLDYISIDKNRTGIRTRIDLVKLVKAQAKGGSRKYFGNVVADNFREISI